MRKILKKIVGVLIIMFAIFLMGFGESGTVYGGVVVLIASIVVALVGFVFVLGLNWCFE